MDDRVRVSDLDFVYISYKEPNKEENWADLRNKVPWAKRVDGVVGFDSVHKAAAELADTEFFISVDGDNIIDEAFLLETLDFEKTNPKAVHRWRARNSVNGLVYGNGGLVGWPKETCLAMKTHENADNEENKLDFCWGVPHENLHNCYSNTVIHADRYQAFTAGYREGVKMSLNKGKAIDAQNFTKLVWPQNLKVLLTWMNVGADVENGKFAMFGARMGCYQTVLEAQEQETSISDLDGMREVLLNYLDEDNIDADLQTYGESLKQRLDIPVANYTEDDSRFFKFVMPQHRNKGVQDREYK